MARWMSTAWTRPCSPTMCAISTREETGAAAEVEHRHAGADAVHAQHLGRVQIAQPQRVVEQRGELVRHGMWLQILRRTQRRPESRQPAPTPVIAMLANRSMIPCHSDFPLCSTSLPGALRLGRRRREANLENAIGKGGAAGVALRQHRRQQHLALEVADADEELVAPFGQLDLVQFYVGQRQLAKRSLRLLPRSPASGRRRRIWPGSRSPKRSSASSRSRSTPTIS